MKITEICISSVSGSKTISPGDHLLLTNKTDKIAHQCVTSSSG